LDFEAQVATAINVIPSFRYIPDKKSGDAASIRAIEIWLVQGNKLE